MKRKPYIIDGVADIRDAVEWFCHNRCLPVGCTDSACPLFAWGARSTVPLDLDWVLRAESRKRKIAADRRRRASR